jgi:hypothetical protein
LVGDTVPIGVVDERAKQPGTVDLRIRVHAEDPDELIVLVSHRETFHRRDQTFCQRGAHVRFTLPKEADMMCSIAIEAGNEVDELVKAVLLAGDNFDQ